MKLDITILFGLHTFKCDTYINLYEQFSNVLA